MTASATKQKPPDVPQRLRAPRETRRQRKAALCRRSLADFILQGWHVLEPETQLEWEWYHDAICQHLEAVFFDWLKRKHDKAHKQRIRNLLINIPPGTLKSRIVSVYFPAWAWLHCPSWRVICLSGNPDVALRDAVYSRTLIESDWYQDTFRPTWVHTVAPASWSMSDEQDAKGHFCNTSSGFRMSKGMTAKATGDRADAIIVDDPNDMKEIHSEAKRNAVNTGWNDGWQNRVNDPRISVRIAIMQRGHELDFSGTVLKKGGWSRLKIPMHYVKPANDAVKHETPIGWSDPRNDNGQRLHPERFTDEFIEEEKRKGAFYIAGQHEQEPAPAGGGMFKRINWRFWKPDGTAANDNQPRPEGCWAGPARALPAKVLLDVLLSVDCAFKGRADNDRVVFELWGQDGADRYLLGCWCDNLSYTETRTRLRDLCKLYPNARVKLVEDKANGTPLMDDLKHEIAGLIGFDPGDKSKESRAWSVTPQIESGNVYLPDGAPWLEEFVGETDGFPRGAHDDMVDALTQALIYLASPSMRAAEGMASW